MKKTFKKPDRKGPRFRTHRVYALKVSMFDEFIKKYPEYKNMTYKDFEKIILTFNEYFCQGFMNNRDGMELPQGLGFVFIGACPAAAKQNIDYTESAKHGMVITHKNWDSDGMLMKIFYTNWSSKYPFKNKQVWTFKANKRLRTRCSIAFKANYAKYVVVDNTKKVSGMILQATKKESMIRNQNLTIPSDWDEFKM